MGRRRSYTAKSNRNNLLGTFVHNWVVDSEKRAKQEEASRKKRAAMEKRQRRKDDRLREIEEERRMRAEERASKQKIRDSREAEKIKVNSGTCVDVRNSKEIIEVPGMGGRKSIVG